MSRPVPQGAYQPASRHRDLAFSAGMTPRRDGRLIAAGRIDGQVTDERLAELMSAACGNALAAVQSVCGPGERIAELLQLTVFVRYSPHERSLPGIADAAVTALERLLEADFTGARTTVGVQHLPGDAPIEVQVTAAIE